MSVVNPSFFVIGAYRSGTTTLYRLLRQHPGVFLPLKKEPNFFAVDGNPDASDVLREWAVLDRPSYEALYRDCGPDQVAGDVSPEYLASPYVAPHLAATVPDARLVAVLRNPIDRAWSDFLLHRRDGNEPCERFADALDQQEARTRDGDHRAGHYIDTGRYADQLRRYHDHFDPSQLQVHTFEDLTADPVGTMGQIFGHIGVATDVEIDPEPPVNASGVPRNPAVASLLKARNHLRPYVNRSMIERVRPVWERFLSGQLDRPMLSDQDRARLVELYADEIEDIGQILGRDLSHWLQPAGSPSEGADRP
ncbi:MAG: sulfotransferase [Actinomycetota bacterium]